MPNVISMDPIFLEAWNTMKNSYIRGTLTLSTCADRSTNTKSKEVDRKGNLEEKNEGKNGGGGKGWGGQ